MYRVADATATAARTLAGAGVANWPFPGRLVRIVRMQTIRIANGRIIDPSQNLDQVADLWVRGDQIVGVGPQPQLAPDRVIDAAGKIICPGLIDMHVHLREPGREEDETISTGTAAALAGGVTSVACMPNTEPAIDSQAAAEFVHLQAERAGNANVFPIGAITKGRAGSELAEIGGLVQGGAVAFTDDGSPVVSAEIMRRAMEYCRMFDKAVLSHSEDLELTRGGVMNEGFESMRLGLRGLPAAAEEVMVYREIALAELTGARVHILHVSTAGSVELIRRGKRRGVRVTGEACPHHFTLTDKCLRTFDSNYKMAPPLRTEDDVQAILEGLCDGTLEVIATDHAPHAPEKKMRELDQAPNGIIGLETLLPVCVQALIEPKKLTWPQLIEKLTINPAKVLGINRGTFKPGAIADVTVIDPMAEWVIDPAKFRSKSRNCPFAGWKVRGRAQTVIVGGVVKFEWKP
jgi:dihydroorotase